MRKLLLLLTLVFAGCVEPYIERPEPVIIEEIDMSENLAPAYGTVTYGGSGSPVSALTQCIDNNLSTTGTIAYTGNTGSYSGYIEVTLDNAYPIETIYMNAVASAVTGSCSGYLQYYDESTGTWVTLNASFAGSGASHAIFTYTVNKTIRRVRIGYNGSIGLNGGTLQLAVYELMMNGDIWLDSGLRIKTPSGVVTLAREPTLSGPLRFRKGGVTYSFVLVNPTDSSASPLRVKTAAGIKAIAKM